ncbi:MAG: phosphotransferase, partial [Acidimicrobiales bacterium]
MTDPAIRRLSMSSFNSVFRVDHSSQQSVLRVGDACRIHPPGVEDVEAAWLRDLADSGFVVPVNIATTDGASHTVFDHSGVPEPRTCSMFRWVEGVPLTQRLSAESMTAAGVLLAELHEHARSDTLASMATDVRADRVVYFHSENRVLTHESRHGTLLVEAIDRIQRLLDEIWRSPPHQPHLLHG